MLNAPAPTATLDAVTTPYGPAPDYGPPPTMYPQYPMGTMGPVAERGGLAQPRPVRLAFWLTLGGAVLFLALMAVALAVSMDDIRDSARGNLIDAGKPFDEGDVSARASGTVFVLVFAALLAAAPLITFGSLLRGGRNWTRVLLTVLVSIGGFVALILMLPPYASLGLLLRLVALALAGVSIAIVALLFSRQANTFFTGPR